MTAHHPIADTSPNTRLRVPRLVALAGTAMVYRFLAPGWRGPVLLCASVLDVLVYALALSIVLESVFQLHGQERFVPMLIGLIALRWSLSSAIQASRVAHFSEVARPYFSRPMLATMILALGPPTFVFLISVGLLGVLTVVLVGGPVDAVHVLGWGLFVAFVQMAWNCVLVLAVIQARLRRILTSEVPIVFGFLLLLIVSPVAYQFSDIPDAASRILTSFNPAAHLIAAYQNAFWYLQDVSLQVLPVSAVLAVLILVATMVLLRKPRTPPGETDDVKPALLLWNGVGWSGIAVPESAEDVRVYGGWSNELPWISAYNFLRLISPSREERLSSRDVFVELAGVRDIDQLESQLPILSRKSRIRVCAAAILPRLLIAESPPENVVDLQGAPTRLTILDGLFDHASEQELRALTKLVASSTVRNLAIRTYRSRVATMLADVKVEADVVARI